MVDLWNEWQACTVENRLSSQWSTCVMNGLMYAMDMVTLCKKWCTRVMDCSPVQCMANVVS